MRLGEDREAVHAVVVDHRHQDRVIGRMGAAVIGRIVQKGVAALERPDGTPSSTGHDVGPAQHMDRQAFGRGQQFVVRREHAAGKIARDSQNSRARAPYKRVQHRPHHSLKPAVDHRQLNRVQTKLF